MKAVQNKITQVVLLFIIIFIVGWILYIFTGYDIYQQENLTFLPPDDCMAVCDANAYREYCNSPYLKEGPEALCNCQWNDQTSRCEGSLAQK